MTPDEARALLATPPKRRPSGDLPPDVSRRVSDRARYEATRAIVIAHRDQYDALYDVAKEDIIAQWRRTGELA